MSCEAYAIKNVQTGKQWRTGGGKTCWAKAAYAKLAFFCEYNRRFDDQTKFALVKLVEESVSVRTVTLSDDMVDSIMCEELQLAVVIQKYTDEGGDDITDYKLRDHLLHSLAYYSTKTEFFAFCESQNIDPKSYWGGTSHD